MFKKILNLKFVIRNCNRGMTYVELIVVLSIFAVMTSIVMFNYGAFQAKVDIKNLESDIALQIVQAQKSSISGTFPPPAQQTLITSTWRPSYGIYVNRVSDNKSFVYFADLDNDSSYTNINCVGIGECLNKITLTKGNTLSRLDVFYQDGTSSLGLSNGLDDLTIIFKRPNSGAIINSTGLSGSVISYVQITVSSQDGKSKGYIKVYPSGRIQVN